MTAISQTKTSTRRIRLGMVGGGSGALIGSVHRLAARMDDHFELVAAAFSSDPLKAQLSANELGVLRSYGSYKEMAEIEAGREDGIDVVAIVTPNHLHAPVALEFLKHGVHVICDKPLTATLVEAKMLAETAAASGVIFALTHNYTGYPMVREARELISRGDLGEIRLVNVEYIQDWLSEPIEQQGQKQAEWRTDPARSGPGGCVGDIGTHAFNLAGFVTGLSLQELSADLQSFVPGRRLDDNGHILLRYTSGARGILWCSQVASGQENGIRLRVIGSKAGLEWEQENPNYLWISPLGQPKYRLTRGGAKTSESSLRMTRVPAGHPEGFLEAFGNIYSEVAQAIVARRDGAELDNAVTFPGLREGLEGVAFVEACVRSSKENAAWAKLAL